MSNNKKNVLKPLKFKNLFSENMKSEIIGLLVIFICIWIVFYLIPELFALILLIYLRSI